MATVLIAIGLASSTLHLGKPGRAWRAFSQWRTSWLSREGVMALVTYLPVCGSLLLIGFATRSHSRARSRLYRCCRSAAAVMAACASATVVCTAMIYASLKTIPAWRHGLVVPGYLAFALLSGGTLLAAMSSFAGAAHSSVRVGGADRGDRAGHGRAQACLLARDRQASLARDARRRVGVPGRDVSAFERPHSEDNYITREMAFTVARKHARRFRALSLVLFGAIPVLVAAVAAWSFRR